MQPGMPITGAPLAAERFGLNAAGVAALAERGGVMRGARLGDGTQSLGAARVPALRCTPW
jgi:hypothetical protein